jgi:hypothetical protein
MYSESANNWKNSENALQILLSWMMIKEIFALSARLIRNNE